MRELGLHLRVETNLVDLVKKAKNLEDLRIFLLNTIFRKKAGQKIVRQKKQ